MGKIDRILEWSRYLQDPHHVARFQKVCGVHGTFSRTSAATSGEADRTHLHNNGVCRPRYGEGERSLVVTEGGDGKKATAPGFQQRTVDPTTTAEVILKTDGDNEHLPRNGAVVTTGGGETVSCRTNGCRLVAESGGTTTAALHASGFSGRTESHGSVAKDPGVPQCSTLKPLRKNSLTGDAGQEFLIENKFLYYLFTFGTELGNESFYITFFPFLMWNVDAFVSRRLIMVWVWVMYLGQCTKDIIGWSRPASPPVVKVEMFYNSEYSMPSTHAMSGTAIPFSLFLMTCDRWEYPFSVGFSLALCWCLLVCLSRIYMGMHSILDIIAGFLYSVLILMFFLPVLDLIDNFNLTCHYAPLIIISLHLGLGLFSFTLDTWSTSRGDTAQILGTGAGVALASHVNHLLGLLPDPSSDQLPFSMPSLSIGLVGMAMLRLCLGVLVLVATRALMKAVTIPLVCLLSGVPSGDVRKARQHMEVELPYRYIVYGTVGFNVLFLVPLLFSYLQLS
ncbi:sphingosine-1-phosphate phosphatase 1 [Lampris incognitus]|uniref:sphingosine-1-phosphate phosphatase 1 n=1 Tax=Lampris incognitus TaxID=2546036 RepID=UPI0024B5F7B4|nr:sphingosine-1-phosphate phosphatase 1 [Lampris incognitus]